MTDASTSENLSPELMKVVERAQREPEGRFHSLAHLIDVPALLRAYHRIRKDGAVGVDGVTKEQYGQKLQENLESLHRRLKAKQYRHQPIRRVHIPKDKGKTRPIGISAFEDRVVQDAVREVLQAIYEQDFLECSHGFRPGRSAHDAIRALDRVVHRGEVNWVLEADIVSFFDSLDRTELKKLIQIRVADGSLLRLIGKCLHVGVLDGADYTEPETGPIFDLLQVEWPRKAVRDSVDDYLGQVLAGNQDVRTYRTFEGSGPLWSTDESLIRFIIHFIACPIVDIASAARRFLAQYIACGGGITTSVLVA
jgi:hypothetical protein